MQVLAESAWSWQLFADGDRLVLDVVCNVGPGMFTRAVELDDAERRAYREQGRPALDALAATVRAAPLDVPARFLPGFAADPRALAAARAWRAAHEGTGA